MTFSLNIIHGILKPYSGSQHIDKKDLRQYKWIALLPEEPSAMEQDVIYACYMSEAMKRNKNLPGYHYVCIRDRYIDTDESCQNLCGMIIVNENRDIAWLFNLIQKRFLELSEWEKSMQLALIDQCSYQKLLNLSEPVLCNFISVLDSSYKLLAYTYNYRCDDPIVVSLLEQGYHSEETIKKFQLLRRFKLYEEANDVIVSKSGEISRYEVASKWCRYGGENMLHTVMVCSNTPLSIELTELFSVFMKYIDICFQREQRQNLIPSKIYSALVLGMLYEDLKDPDLIADQSKRSGLPMMGNFDFYRIVFEDNAIVLIGRFVQELMTYLPLSKIISKDYEVSVLNIYNESNFTEESDNNIKRIVPLLDHYKGVCGVSDRFASLIELKNASIQAARAYSLGSKFSKLGNFWKISETLFGTIEHFSGKRVYKYDGIAIYYMMQLSESGPIDARNTSYVRSLEKLRHHDQVHGSNLAEILYSYLLCERSATAASKFLHMHRNNVLYHINRICDMTGFDLDDYWVRFKLLLGFHYLELQAASSILS